eukprot:Blabericola_migrator_1__2326@NODE_164_length_12331_cov_134_122880_g142_i0_p3_GENE_NODE_164_length_12331_cov_134_122880_g142_i0NODE_164_length_12331_cov_134_122880_g142_i0_p3_ORF_typecomplete_len469_score43_23Fbox/PF00646_33/8_9e08Fboxlike/PF12937_7/0_0003Fboxlike/PF12937_7/3_7e03_NODE_164_length_12331_cov_134_122880_g142_i038355241
MIYALRAVCLIKERMALPTVWTDLSADLLIRCFSYLDMTSLQGCRGVCQRFNSLIDGHQLSSRPLWTALLNREHQRWGPHHPDIHFAGPKSPFCAYGALNTTFYLLELSRPIKRLTLYVLENCHSALEHLLNEIFCAAEERLLIHHLLRNGLDITLHTVYRGLIVSSTPLYDHILLRIGDEWNIRMIYLGGFDDKCDCCSDLEMSDIVSIKETTPSTVAEEEISPCRHHIGVQCRICEKRSPHSSTAYLKHSAPPLHRDIPDLAATFVDDTDNSIWVMSHTFYREGRRCRYQITAYKKGAQGVEEVTNGRHGSSGVESQGTSSCCEDHGMISQVSLTHPPTLFLDIIILNLSLRISGTKDLPSLDPAGVPLATRSASSKVAVVFDMDMPPLKTSCFLASLDQGGLKPMLRSTFIMTAPYHYLNKSEERDSRLLWLEASHSIANEFEGLPATNELDIAILQLARVELRA